MKSELYVLIQNALRDENTEAVDRLLQYFINNYPEIDESLEWDEIRNFSLSDLEQVPFETAPLVVIRETVQHVKNNFDMAESLYWREFSEKYRTAFNDIIQAAQWMH